MRPFWGYFTLICFGIAIALFIAFQSFFSDQDLVEDTEQEGMKEQITIKFSHVVAANTPKGLAANHFAELVDEYTNHKVKVEVFPNQSLYSDQEEIDALLNNKIQMIAPTTSKLTEIEPQWLVLDLPYIFPNHDALREVLDGEIGNYLLSQLNDNNMKAIGFWPNSFKQVTSNSPIYEPEDFKGKTFRIMPSEVIARQFELFGGKVSKLEFNETFDYLEKNYTNSQENTISNIYSKKLYENQKYLTISNHGFLGYGVIMNHEFWDGLPSDVQAQITRAMDETTEWVWKESEKLNQQLLDEIRKKSFIEIYELSEREREAWMEKFEILYSRFNPIIGNELMESVLNVRKKYME